MHLIRTLRRSLLIVVLLSISYPISAAAEQRELIVATRDVPPFAMQSQTGEWSGITIDLWERIAAEMGLSYRYEHRSIDQMLSGLEDRSLDVAAAALTITSERERIVDFSHPFYYTGLGIAVAAQPEVTWMRVMRGLISLQFLQVIGALMLVLFVFGALVWIFERRRNPQQFGGDAPSGIGAGFWWSAVTMTTVGYGDKAPITLGGRLIALIWMFSSIIIISSITAAITSALTVASLESGIRGPEDLPHVTVATIRDTTSEHYLTARGIRARTFPTLDEALQALSEGTVQAVVYDAPILQYAISRSHLRGLTVLPRDFEQQQYGFALQFDSPLRQELNRTLLLLSETGELDRIRQRYLGE